MAKRALLWIGRPLLALARSRAGGALAGWSLAHMSHLLPLARLGETDHTIAFRHPRPAYPVHILIVPKRAIGGLLEVSEDDLPFLQDALLLAQRLVRELRLEGAGYRLLLNGGRYQDVKQLHIHLVSGDPA